MAFDATTVTVRYLNNIVLTSSRNTTTKLWHLQLPPTTYQANGAVGSATPAQIVAFAHAALFSPALSTLETAIQRGYLTNFPGLTARALRKHPPQSYAMIKGHLDHVHQNQRSTKTPVAEPTSTTHSDQPTEPYERSHHCYATVMAPTGQIYTDQTGKFITPSSNGNNYLMIVYDYDSNHIFAEPF